MGYTGTIGLQYGTCEAASAQLETAARCAQDDAAILSRALSCAHEASGAVSSAIGAVHSAASNMQAFSAQVRSYVTGVQDYDEEFAKALEVGDDFVSKAELDKWLGLAGTGIDAADAARTAFSALKSKCEIIEKNGYYIIKGLAKNREGLDFLEDIKGTRYKIGSSGFVDAGLDRYLPKGARSAGAVINQYAKNLPESIKHQFISQTTLVDGLEQKHSFGSDTFSISKSNGVLSKAGKVLSYAAIAVDVGGGIAENMHNGETKASKYAADIMTDTAKGVGGMVVATACAKVGAAIGTAIPILGIGTVVGAVAGFALGMAGSWLYDNVIDGVKIGDKTVAEWVSSGAEALIDKTAEAVGGFFTGIGSAVSSVFA